MCPTILIISLSIDELITFGEGDGNDGNSTLEGSNSTDSNSDDSDDDEDSDAEFQEEGSIHCMTLTHSRYISLNTSRNFLIQGSLLKKQENLKTNTIPKNRQAELQAIHQGRSLHMLEKKSLVHVQSVKRL